MSSEKARPTVDEIYEILRRTSLPTVLVEGKDDIIFYRSVEHELRDLDVDMFPAGNKDAVLELRRRIKENPISAPVVFVVDNDLWVYSIAGRPSGIEDLITTTGYSIENDLFIDGDLESFLRPDEVSGFKSELKLFLRWYALSINRNINGLPSSFRTHAGKVLDDKAFYEAEMTLQEGEVYPEALLEEIQSNYGTLLRGKSLFALLLRQLSGKKRDVKFGGKQLMEIGASRKGSHFRRIQISVRKSVEQALGTLPVS
ncbi:DUF4435 domain-containing protein [Cupriavidus malaysiensis]|uniref:DUF4435 domain-containing protein n=1 Tax=Cupriavidus malaysiensis TaxID=367825 RepID=UPI0009FBD4DF|nr:DUF4435 domain-containing protein [Cupriavidus malaysiensis]